MLSAIRQAPARAVGAARVVRMYLAAQAVTSFGDGLWFTTWVLYLTNERGFAPDRMGLAVGLGGLLGLAAAAPVGLLADRLGPSRVLTALCAVESLAMLVYLQVSSFWLLVAITAVYAAASSSSSGVRVTLVSFAVATDERVIVLARGRSVQCAVYAVGAGAGALVVAAGSSAGYRLAIVVNALSFVLAGILAALTRVGPQPLEQTAEPVSGAAAVRDFPYVAVMTSTAVLGLCMAMLSTGLPLWVQHGTHAPLWLAPVSVVASCGLIAVLQVRTSATSRTLAGAVRTTRYAGVLLAASCVVFACAGLTRDAGLASAIIVAGLLAQIAGELLYVASRWGLSLELMHPRAQGQYQGVAAATEAAVLALGPTVLALMVTNYGSLGWVLLAPVFVLVTLPTAWISHRALLRRRAARHA